MALGARDAAGMVSTASASARNNAAGAINMVLRRVTGWAPGRLVRDALCREAWQSVAYCYGVHHERTLNAWFVRPPRRGLHSLIRNRAHPDMSRIGSRVLAVLRPS